MIRLCLLAVILSVTGAQNCASCIAGGQKWCASSSSCGDKFTNCATEIKVAINCPLPMKSGYEYSDSFARQTVLPLISAAYATDPVPCLRNQLPSTQFYKSVKVQCYSKGPNATCHAYTAFDSAKKAIIVSFEGTEGNLQLTEEIIAFFHKKTPFFDEGNVFQYFYDAFHYLWSGGLESSVRSLLYLYPDYELWAVGHSMGAAISSVFASHAIKTNLFTPEKVKLVTFGQPRTGDQAFAQWHDNTFLYSYRIVHHKDPAPHVPPLGGPDEIYHHRYEVWYNNNMTVGEPYTVCLEADGPYCSNTHLETVGNDHLFYFNRNMSGWANAGCPTQWNTGS